MEELEKNKADVVSQYELLDAAHPNTDVFQWWSGPNVHANLAPVKMLAFRYLSTPASSVASESAFSHAGLTITDLRSRLTGENASVLLSVHLNRRYVFLFARLYLTSSPSSYRFIDDYQAFVEAREKAKQKEKEEKAKAKAKEKEKEEKAKAKAVNTVHSPASSASASSSSAAASSSAAIPVDSDDDC
jgi:hypothetical protein